MITKDIARCPGDGSDEEGWREGCDDCLRRTSPPPADGRVQSMQPPKIVAFWCEHHIPADCSRSAP